MTLRIRKPSRRIGGYDLIEKIATGGMGSIYRSRNRTTGETVAVKVVTPSSSDSPVLLQRFEQEFQAARSLHHPHVVRALDFGHDGGSLYLVMEFVDGGSLADLIEQQELLPEEQAVRLIVQVAQALQEAHDGGIVHRDVKPANILLTADGRAKLADLGLVKNVGADLDLTRPLSGLGTPHFMPPEQFEDAKHADARCDVYALGATLYMALTGTLPFDGRGGHLGILKRKIANQITPARELVPTLSEDVEAAIRRSMNPDREKRTASCRAFIQDLNVNQPLPWHPGPTKLLTPGPMSGSNIVPASGSERRAAQRHLIQGASSCRSIWGDRKELWAATAVNVSATGIGLLLRRRFEPGTVLVIDFPAQADDGGFSLPVRVVRILPQPPDHWLVGCVFGLPLRDNDLRTLL